MTVNMMTWNEIVLYTIEVLLKLVVAALIPYAFSLVRKKLNNDKEVEYLNRFEKMVKDAVDQVQQTYVSHMKAENLFDKEAQIEAFNMVKVNVLNMMNEEMQEFVMDAVGDFDEYIRNKIEADVFIMKNENRAILEKKEAKE